LNEMRVISAILPDLLRPKMLSPAAELAIRPGEAFRECSICPDMVVVPAGSFLMGSPNGSGEANERPQHQVTFSKPFPVSKFEITFDQWDACVALGGCETRVPDQGWGRGSRPVINVNWDDAANYASWLSKRTGERYRLLSEAEWEYAACAGRPVFPEDDA